MSARLHVALSLLVAATLSAAPLDVWIDADPALGLPARDADDGFALVQALRSPRHLRVRGISVSFGNAPRALGLPIAREVARRFGGPRPPPVTPGAERADDRGVDLALLRDALRQRPLTYVALGPLTHLAAFLRHHPREARRIRRVVILAGRAPGETLRVGPWNPYRFHDANFEKDPAAVAAALASRLPVTLVPMHAALACDLRPTDLARIAASGPEGAWLARRARWWLRLWRAAFGVEGGPMFDSVAVLAASHPGLVDIGLGHVRIVAAGGRPTLEWTTRGPGRAVRVARGTRAGAREEILLALGAR